MKSSFLRILMSYGAIVEALFAMQTDPKPATDELTLKVFSTETLNSFFDHNGYKKDFWSYSSPVHIVYDNASSRLILQAFNRESVYTISKHGQISEITKSNPGVCFLDEKEDVEIAFGNRKLLVGKLGYLALKKGEYVPVVDANHRLYARRFKNENGSDSFAVFDKKYRDALFTASGMALYVESKADSIRVITAEPDGVVHQIRTYRKKQNWDLVESIEIKAPVSLRKRYYFSFQHVDFVRGLAAFVEYSVPKRFFSKDKIWVYDIAAGKFITDEKIPNMGGNIYAFFLPENLADVLD